MRSRFLALAALTGTVALGSIANAGQQSPGSLLVFPCFDNRIPANALVPSRNITLLTVTNTHPSLSVEVHYVYRDENCLETNRSRILTANDTISVITAFDNPNADQGYIYVYAQSPTTHAPIKWDWLIGTAIDLRNNSDDLSDSNFEYAPYMFHAASRLRDGDPTDRDGDGLRDLNGLEYERAPDVLLVPRFFGNDDPNGGNPHPHPAFHTELCLINLTGGRQFDAVVDFIIYNDNEEAFSAQYAFRCWSRVALLDIDSVFSHQFLKNSTNHAAGEVAGAPANFPETGWFTIDGNTADSSAAHFDDPAILALRVENDTADGRCGGSLIPFCLGVQDNGDLLALGLLGDTDDTP